jgi:hypothetical protein
MDVKIFTNVSEDKLLLDTALPSRTEERNLTCQNISVIMGMQFWLPGVLAPAIWTIRKCSKIGVPRTIL